MTTKFPDQDVVREAYEAIDEFIGKAYLCLQKYDLYSTTWVDIDSPPEWEIWNIYRIRPVDHYDDIEIPYPEPCRLCNVGRGCNGDCYYEDFTGDDHEDYSSK